MIRFKKMGSYISSFFKRVFAFPIKRKPICYYRQEDFASTGIPLYKGKEKVFRDPKVKVLESFQRKFYTKLLRERQKLTDNKMQERKGASEEYPGWNELTLSNIHSLFLLFNNRNNGMLNFSNFSAILDSLGDVHSHNEKKKRFNSADSDRDGWLSYDDFLKIFFYR